METFEALLGAHRLAVERFVKFHVRSEADAEDILQETYLAAYLAFPRLKDGDAFRPWLISIARNKWRDWYRRQARRPDTPVEELPEVAAPEPADTAVEETLERLSDRDARMLRLFYLEQLPQKQIAQQLSIPQGTVKSRLSAARQRFAAAYAYPPKGEKTMKNLPMLLPEYHISWKDEAPFPVVWEEMMGWGIVPRLGEKLTWGMYDLPSRKLDVAYDMAVTGKARVHGLEGVIFTARVREPKPALEKEDLMNEPVACSGAKEEVWTFVGQLKDGYTRFLSAERTEDGVRTLTTFLDGEEFMANWGFGEDNRGNSIHPEARGLIHRDGDAYTAQKEGVLDVVGRCTLTLDGKSTDCIAIMDLSAYMEGVASLQFLDRSGHTLLWQRFNRDDWELDRYGKRWSELLPENERITVNGVTFVHWYDCLYLR